MFGKELTGKEARKLIDDENGILIDIRADEEYNERHIEGCTLIPLNVLGYEIESIVEEYDRPIILYCRSGQRTKIAAVVLSQLGYSCIYDLGGIDNWYRDME